MLNTFRRFGEPLPAAGNPPELQRIFQTGEPVITDLFLPPGWIAAIFDTEGTIVARTRDAQRLVGQKGSPELVQRMKEVREDTIESRTLEGIPVLTVFTRSPVSNWTVAIGIPQRELTAHLWYSMGRLFAAGFVALLTALGLAALFSRRLMR